MPIKCKNLFQLIRKANFFYTEYEEHQKRCESAVHGSPEPAKITRSAKYRLIVKIDVSYRTPLLAIASISEIADSLFNNCNPNPNRSNYMFYDIYDTSSSGSEK